MEFLKRKNSNSNTAIVVAKIMFFSLIHNYCFVNAIRESTVLCLNHNCQIASSSIQNLLTYNSQLQAATLYFDIGESLTPERYHKILQDLRDKVALPSTRGHGFLVTQPPALTRQQPYITVEVTNERGKAITLIIETSTSYIIAFKSNTDVFALSNSPESFYAQVFDKLYPGAAKVRLPFGSNDYKKLEMGAKKMRAQVPLGFSDLNDAINELHSATAADYVEKYVAKELLVVCQMISDAARYYPIEILLTRTIGTHDRVFLDTFMIGLADRWGDLSKQIQLSNGGVFGNPVQLLHPLWGSVHFDRIDGILNSMIAFLLEAVIRCKAELNDNACAIAEPTVMLARASFQFEIYRDCAVVDNGEYEAGKSLKLFECDVNNIKQKWVLRRDGTINTPGGDWCIGGQSVNNGQRSAPISIHSCQSASKDMITWKLFGNGTFQHVQSKWYLVAPFSYAPTYLTLDRELNDFKWLASTDPYQMLAVNVFGPSGLCLTGKKTSSGFGVYLAKCDNNSLNQQWIMHDSGKLEYVPLEGQFLTGGPPNAIVTVMVGGCSYQRWDFENDGAVRNLNNGVVLEAAGPDVRASLYTGDDKQKWRLMVAGVRRFKK